MDATIENCAIMMRTLTAISNIADGLFEEYVPRPFLSALLDDSIERAQDLRAWNYKHGYREYECQNFLKLS